MFPKHQVLFYYFLNRVAGLVRLVLNDYLCLSLLKNMMWRMMKKLNFLLLILVLATVTVARAESRSSKPMAGHVLVIGIDGWGGYSIDKAHDIPNITRLMQQGCYTTRKRSVLPSDSGVNWASMFNGSCPELHGFTTWGSHKPEIPSAQVNAHGIFPTIFSLLRDARPDVVTGCIAEWDGIKYVVDTLSIDYYDLAPNWEHDTVRLCEMAEQFIINRKPTLLAVCWDQLDHTGHTIGHDTPEYYNTLASIDVYVGRLIKALETAGIADDTIIIMTSDHGGVGKGHGGKTLLEMEHPFIICGPGIRAGVEILQPMMQYDTAATIAYIFGLEMPCSWVGRPVLSVFKKLR